MKKAGIKPEDFFSGPMETCVWKGKTYGLPLNTCTKALFYRKDMLESVGVKPPKTWEELIDVAKKLTKDVDGDGEIDVWGFVYDGAWSWHFNPFLWQAGGMELSPDKKECVINSEEGIRALQFLLDLIYVHKVAPPPEKWKWGIEAIAKGEGAMAIDGPWGWACAHDLFGLDVDKYLGVTLLPKGPVREASVTGGENIVIPKFTKHPNEAFKVAQYMVSYHFQVEMIKADVFPTLKAAAMDPLIKENPLWSVFAKQMEVALPRAVHPAYGKINEIIHTYLEKAFYRELSAKEALDTIKVEVDKLLKGG
jgi:multiple sugar transport system substrate-binding protein